MTTFLDINFDVDAYLARGGKLLEIEMLSEKQLVEFEDAASSGFVSDEIFARAARVGRYLERLSQFGLSKSRVGEVVTEEDARTIWRASARADR